MYELFTKETLNMNTNQSVSEQGGMKGVADERVGWFIYIRPPKERLLRLGSSVAKAPHFLPYCTFLPFIFFAELSQRVV